MQALSYRMAAMDRSATAWPLWTAQLPRCAPRVARGVGAGPLPLDFAPPPAAELRMNREPLWS
ncbi:MAG: hypothetical protein ABR590_11815, partial [Spirochaetia bacterium]